MVFFSIGLPSRFADWCDALIGRLVECRIGAIQAVPVNTFDELATAVIRTDSPNLLASCRQPVPRFQNEIIAAGRAFVVALGDPREALYNLVVGAGLRFEDAVRAIASSCAAMLAIAKAPHALVMTPADARDLPALATAVMRHFQIPLGPTASAPVGEGFAEPGWQPEGADSANWAASLAAREQAIVGGALAPYLAHFAGDHFDRLVWEPELFYIGNEPPTPTLIPAARPVEITGRVRYLIYGPFINLPAGPWSADIVLGTSAEAAGMSFSIEVFAGAQLAHARIVAAGEQVIETRLYFTIEPSLDQPVQIRVSNERAAFDGRLALGYVAMTPQAVVPQETRERLVSALRQ